MVLRPLRGMLSRQAVLPAAALLFTAAAVTAQEAYYLNAFQLGKQPGDSVKIYREAAETTATHRKTWSSVQSDWFFLRLAGTQQNLTGLPPVSTGDGTVDVKLPHADVAVLGSDLRPRIERLSGSNLEQLVATAGSEPAPRRPSGRSEVSPFPVSTPEDQGMDSQVLADMVEDLFDSRQDFRPNRVIIFRHGATVLDITFHPFARGVRHSLASIGKLVTGTLIGIAIDRGFIGSVDDPVLSYFPDREIANRDSRKEAMTIAHLLEQRSGIYHGDDGTTHAEDEAMQASPDWVQWMLDQPMSSEPGEVYYYSNANAHLAAGVLAQATGKTPLQFARQYLFGPLRISDVFWEADPQGVNRGNAGQQLLPMDIAKLGFLYLSGGDWRGTQVVSADWVELALTPHPGSPPPGWPPEMSTGFHWAINSRLGIFDAAGSGGQIIRLEPDNDLMLIVVAGGGPGYNGCSWNGRFVEDWLEPYVSQAILSSSPLAANPQGVDRLASLVASASLAGSPEPVPPLPAIANTISGQRFVMEANPILEWFSLSFPGGSEALLEHQGTDTGYVAVRVGLDNVFRVSPGQLGLPFAAKGWWAADKRFALLLDVAPLISFYNIEALFGNGEVTLTLQDTACGGEPAILSGHQQSLLTN